MQISAATDNAPIYEWLHSSRNTNGKEANIEENRIVSELLEELDRWTTKLVVAQIILEDALAELNKIKEKGKDIAEA